ncbi:Sensor protein CpxA [compost metagenome]
MQQDDDEVLIRILDRGPGIPASSLEQVFVPFFRLEGSRNKSTGGVGLGLSAARAIVLEHGGELTLRNRSIGGLEARVVLPVRALPQV